MAARLPAICAKCGARVELHLSVWCVPGTLTKHVCKKTEAANGGNLSGHNNGPGSAQTPPGPATTSVEGDDDGG